MRTCFASFEWKSWNIYYHNADNPSWVGREDAISYPVRMYPAERTRNSYIIGAG